MEILIILSVLANFKAWIGGTLLALGFAFKIAYKNKKLIKAGREAIPEFKDVFEVYNKAKSKTSEGGEKITTNEAKELIKEFCEAVEKAKPVYEELKRMYKNIKESKK